MLESTGPCASSGGSNFEIRALEADLVSSGVARLPKIWKLVDKMMNSFVSPNLKRDEIGPKLLNVDV